MKTTTIACLLGITAVLGIFTPWHSAEAKQDRDVVVIRHDRDPDCERREHHRHHRHSQRFHDHRRSGVLFSFNFSPTPVYHTPVRRVVTVNRTVVQDVQLALIRCGYDVGPVDGIAGYRIRSALADFQSRRGLHPSGTINEPTLRALGLI